MEKHGRQFACLGASLVVVFITAGAAAAQESSGSPSSPAPSSRTSAPGNDIKVHGHWTIEVRNPNGSVASHNEFENACYQCNTALAVLLARQATVSLWRVELVDTTFGEGPCMDFNGAHSYCVLEEVGVPVSNQNSGQVFATLEPMAPQNQGQYVGTLELTGNFTASFAGSIGSVASEITASTSAFWLFSYRDLATAIPVAAGQHVYVRVTFSFT